MEGCTGNSSYQCCCSSARAVAPLLDQRKLPAWGGRQPCCFCNSRPAAKCHSKYALPGRCPRVPSSRPHIVRVSSTSNRQDLPEIDPEQREKVETLIRERLLKDLPNKRRYLDTKLEWAIYYLVGAFALYKCVVENEGPYHLDQFHFDLTTPDYLPWMLVFQFGLVQIPVGAIAEVIDAIIELKLHERNCVAWCGKDSIKY